MSEFGPEFVRFMVLDVRQSVGGRESEGMGMKKILLHV